MTRFLLLFLLLTTFSGCSKLQHLDELLTLKSVADSQAAMAKEVEAVNKRFDQLAAAVRSGEIEKYDSPAKVRRHFGDPILEREERMGDDTLTMWLYRYATEYFNADKVYLYFDASGKLDHWEYMQVEQTANNDGGTHEQEETATEGAGSP